MAISNSVLFLCLGLAVCAAVASSFPAEFVTVDEETGMELGRGLLECSQAEEGSELQYRCVQYKKGGSPKQQQEQQQRQAESTPKCNKGMEWKKGYRKCMCKPGHIPFPYDVGEKFCCTIEQLNDGRCSSSP